MSLYHCMPPPPLPSLLYDSPWPSSTDHVPSYSSRLPQLCDSLSRKLGGPVIVVSPPKPKVAKKSSSSHHRSSDRRDQRPGAAAKRTALHKRPQTLEHALSFEREHRRSVSRGPSQIEDLMRATSAAMPSIKREDSDLTARSSAVAPPSRGGDADSRRSSLSRSSSMTAIAGASDDPNKARRKAKIDAELRDAISNLRKPNRSVVGQAISAESERHRAMTGAKSRHIPLHHRFVCLLTFIYRRTQEIWR